MSRATMDSARVAGALAGATLTSTVGVAGAYAFVATFYLASLALTFGVSKGRPVPDPSGGHPGSGPASSITLPRASNWRDLVDGLVHVWTTPKLLAPTWLAFLVNMTAYPISGGLLPYVAKTVYRTDATGLGALVAGYSIGALLGSIAMVVSGGARHPERSMVVNIGLWYAVLLGFGHAPSVPAAFAALMLAGLIQSFAMISMSVSLLSSTADRFRGRVMGVRTLAVYGLPIGLMAAGVLIDRIGFPAAVTAYSVIGLAFTLLIVARWRSSIWDA